MANEFDRFEAGSQQRGIAENRRLLARMQPPVHSFTGGPTMKICLYAAIENRPTDSDLTGKYFKLEPISS